MAVSEGGFMSSYFYDCNGERTVKLSSGREALYVNASRAYNADSLPQKFVAYVSPYLVVSNGGQYTKHIYAGNQRIASKLGNIDDFGADPRRVDYAGADLKDINYDEKYKSEVKELETRYDSLGNDCTFRVVNDYVNGKSFCCDNNDIEIFNRPDSENDNSEESAIYYYHPDHLGSTSMVTDHEGRITQNVVYIPFGEVFVEQRDGNWNTPYLFNAKELDEETGMYYYGARYLDPTSAQWLSVDPLFEKYAGMSPYNYCAGNPVKLVDVDGKQFSEEMEKQVVELEKEVDEMRAIYDNLLEKFSYYQNSSNKKERKKWDTWYKYKSDLEKIGEEIKTLRNSNILYDIEYGPTKSSTPGIGVNSMSMTFWNEENKCAKIRLWQTSDIALFAHELKHLYQFQMGKLSLHISSGSVLFYDMEDEQEAHLRESSIQNFHVSIIKSNYTDIPRKQKYTQEELSLSKVRKFAKAGHRFMYKGKLCTEYLN